MKINDDDESESWRLEKHLMKEEYTFLREKAGNRSDGKISLGSVDFGQTSCCAGDCSRTTVVTVVPNKRQTTSPVDAAPSTDRLRRSLASLIWRMRLEHGSRTMELDLSGA